MARGEAALVLVGEAVGCVKCLARKALGADSECWGREKDDAGL